MKRVLSVLVALCAWLSLAPAAQALTVVATTPDLAAISKAVGREHVKVTALALHTQDPHFVDPRPHLALDLARADLLLVTGADLEVGWLATLQVGSRNGAIQPGAPGFLDCSSLVELLERPSGKVDRAQGDVHPAGNPHYMLDPRAVERVAVGIAKRMATLDPRQKNAYLENARAFLAELRKAREVWEKRLASARGAEIVTYHKSLGYLSDWLGLKVVETIEPRPGIPPNPRHVAHVVGVAREHKVRVILQESWYPTTTSRLIAKKVGATLVQMPGMPNFPAGQSYVAFMSEIVKRLDDAL
ncbi:MAG TPA: zinc ABC transporter substrate-binding protein [Polyangiaceae bacterium]|nr:zinc ABC transporter substrate-binding protein [Polyangiaceae bacterium]